MAAPLSLVQDGDSVFLDVPNRRLTLEISDEEMQLRASIRQVVDFKDSSGYVRLYREHVMGADTGCDFDFLVGRRGSEVPRRST